MKKPIVRILPKQGDATRALVWVHVRDDLYREKLVQVSACEQAVGRDSIPDILASLVRRAVKEVQRDIEAGMFKVAA